MPALPQWLVTALYQNSQSPQQSQAGPRPYPKNPLDPNDPNYDPTLDPHNPQYNPNDPRLVGGVSPYVLANGPPPISGPRLPNGPMMSAQAPPAQGQTPQVPYQLASQQPLIPIQSPQGAPQGMVTAPNSGLTGFAPPSGPVLGMGGNGGGQFYGLGTQSPSPGPGESPMASGPLLGKQVSPQQIYNQLNAPRIQQFLQQLAQMQKQFPTFKAS